MDLSIIVPAYNSESYLSECLDSLVGQVTRGRKIEIIVINDGSTDKTADVMMRFASIDPRVITISQKNGGVGSARNKGLSIACGKYIMFVDADDYIAREDAIELLLRTIENEGEPDVLQFERVCGKRKPRLTMQQRSRSTDQINNFMIGRMIVDETINPIWNKLYKRSIIQDGNINFVLGIRMGEDLLFNVQYFLSVRTVLFLSEELYFYREDNQGSATKKYMPNKYDDLNFVNNTLGKLTSNSGSDAIKNALKYIRIKNVISCTRDLCSNSCSMERREKMDAARRYKRDNGGMLIQGYGFRKILIGCVYSCMSGEVLYELLRLLDKAIKK